MSTGVLPESADPVSDPKSELRRRLVADAIKNWVAQTIDLGGRNRLLYFRPLKRGTLDLSSGTQDPVDRLLRGLRVKISDIFEDDDTHTDAALRCRTIKKRADEYDQERGILTLRVGFGFATWKNDKSASTPNAPVLLRDAVLTSIGRLAEDFELQLTNEWELNPSLVHALTTDFGIRLESIDLGADIEDNPHSRTNLEECIRETTRQFSEVDEFKSSVGIVLANFTYTKIAQVIRLQASEIEIAEHELLSAIAGDPAARHDLQQLTDGVAELSPDEVDLIPPENEFLVLDADSSQSIAIAAALGGRNLVVVGPPGTGKSQTIANMIASYAAHGKRVLFVAEKRAAIEAVTKRLDQVGLGDLVLDMHAGASSKRKVAEDLSAALETTRRAVDPDLNSLHRNLSNRRAELNEYVRALHRERDPWALSTFQAQNRILDLERTNPGITAFEDLSLANVDIVSFGDVIEAFQPFIRLGGIRIWRDLDSPWHEAFIGTTVRDTGVVRAVQQALTRLRTGLLNDLRSEVDQAAQECRAKLPTTIRDLNSWQERASELKKLLSSVQKSLFDEDLETLQRDLRPATRGHLARLVSKTLSAKYRRAIRVVMNHSINNSAPEVALAGFVKVAINVQSAWPSRDADTDPTVPRRLDELINRLAEVGSLAKIIDHHSSVELDALSLVELERTISRLSASSGDLINLPQLGELKDRLEILGMAPFLGWCIESSLAEEDTVSRFEYSWLRAVLTEISISDRTIGGFNGIAQDKIVVDFVDSDQSHVESGAQRVRRSWAENSVAVRDAHPDQSATVRHQARLKRAHMPVRELIARAPNVVSALKPCWVMSPLAVAETLPPGNHFDVVMFDEASQILPADAILSILQADQAVVVGDPKQLPPTVFFQSSDEGIDEESDDYEFDQEPLRSAQQFALTRDLESILDVMQATLPVPMGTRVLEWHYRSQDERLIAFSNWHPDLYAGQLTTFPGALGGDRVRHELIPYVEHSGPLSSYSPEVERVVEMALDHAEKRPEESLGVITMGVRHRDRVEELLRLERRNRPDLDEFFSETRAEPFFVKNLENVQGDERDAVILSMGYSKASGGRMRYNFGPVNQEGGERRLNVAITRARKRIAITSCFSGMEMDSDRLNGVGPQMLKEYLEYAASGGTKLPQRAAAKIELNAFEMDVRDTLVKAGIRVQPQYGVSGYWIDFAAMHPDRPEEPVLAIEADGATYHSSQSARDRDRLRQEHLERLGWSFFRIWSTEWFQNKESVTGRLKQAYADAVAKRDRPNSIEKFADDVPPPISGASNDAIFAPERSERPWIPYRWNIQDIPSGTLVGLIKWINSDGLLRTEDELVQEATRELGYNRRGSKIVTALIRAIRRVK